MKKLFSLLICLVLVLSLSVTAFAADGSITYQGRSKILLTPSMTTYTDTDMFDNFKGVMPGDVLLEEVKITNMATDCDYVKVYLRAIPHGATNQPSRKIQESVASMNDFLSQLHMEVKNGTDVIYSASPDEPAQLTEPVYIGSLRRFKTAELDVKLTVPKTLGNEYADREGEVDWEFTFEAYRDPADASPKTGDYIMIAVAVMAVSAIALVVILTMKRRKAK